MNPLLDCPLKLPLKKAVKLMELCEVSAFIINKKGRISATCNLPEKLISNKTALKTVLITPFSKLTALKDGEMLDIKLQLEGEETAVAASFSEFYFVVLSSSTKTVKNSVLEKGVGFDDGGKIGVLAKESFAKRKSEDSATARKRRDLKRDSKYDAKGQYPLRDLSVREKLGKTANKTSENNGLFDPAKALEAVCVIASTELSKHGIRLHTNVAPSRYLSSVDENAYFIALSMLLMVGADNAEGRRLSVEGTLRDGEYVASIILEKPPRFEKAASKWSLLFGDYAIQLKELAQKHFWSFSIHRRADGYACISLAVRVTQKSSVSFLRYGEGDPLYAVVLQRLSSFEATKHRKNLLVFDW